ncbi:DUF4136 domain-containing protein [uncultured Litoreibacter sp.]|uniref:DUF4136 domain-containing protein n=1 Tax=uncultured Litoreibacter sp. TaxID=1392394 RepID=UPI00263286F7|nr:DUF4136 domain-containing protein [uncultured Litoreibacter sp.]
MSTHVRFYILRTLLILPFLILSACDIEPEVFTDYDTNQDFSGYKTFAWSSNSPLVNSGEYPISPLAERRMTGAIQAVFKGKGYRFTSNRSNADFVVSYTMGARDKILVREYPDLFRDTYSDWDWGQPYYGVGYRPPLRSPILRQTRTEIDEFAQGTLSIDVFDLKRRTPVWHAQASKRLSQEELNRPSGSGFVDAASVVLDSFPSREQ